ncbi:hypothetical protein PHAVU_003G103600 [Phaseolus vulgaris]|uniref:Uncharacterized protein n=1 Tax=Phaseolus vulgaris TaxID=3885 RepID=V7C7W4_PHAVU|nr:hypothetical protein PHAVU_003G103600g [Phaseolus vulgaris]ESW26252.1 hypothetical protein PHAVU_003G103600g [Phaseolus vulgaris]
MTLSAEEIIRLETTGVFWFINSHGELGYVDRALAIEFQKELEQEWTLADSEGNVHIVQYNENLLSPEMLCGWFTLTDFYGFIDDHYMLLCYVG